MVVLAAIIQRQPPQRLLVMLVVLVQRGTQEPVRLPVVLRLIHGLQVLALLVTQETQVQQEQVLLQVMLDQQTQVQQLT